ncbi:hypothetical protein ACTXT7_013712 [Hymenolepis weldensis]
MDHKPLLSIFGSKKCTLVCIASQLQRLSTILLGYDFDIEYETQRNSAKLIVFLVSSTARSGLAGKQSSDKRPQSCPQCSSSKELNLQAPRRLLQTDTAVNVRELQLNGIWAEGIIRVRRVKVLYEVDIDGKTWACHLSHLRPSLTGKKIFECIIIVVDPVGLYPKAFHY